MNIDVEDRLHRQLPGIADRANLPAMDLDQVMRRVGRRRRRRVAARGATAACGLALVVGGLVAVTGRGGAGEVDTAANPDAGPTRTEVPLLRLPHALVSAGGVAKGEALGFELGDGNKLIFSVTAFPFFDTYYQSICRSMSGETSCWPVDPSVQLDPLPWNDLELAGNNDMVAWIGLPPSVSTVELRQGDDVSWQHVVDGLAAFPVEAHDPSDEGVAFDAAGVEILRASWSTVTLTGESTRIAADGSFPQPMYTWSSTFGTEAGDFVPEVDATTLEGMTQTDEDAYRAFADATMRQCLVDEGSAAWNSCLVSTEGAVKDYLAERP